MTALHVKGGLLTDIQSRQAHGAARAMMVAVFVLLFVFSYSEEIVGLLFDAIGLGGHDAWRASLAWRTLVVLVEMSALLLVALMKRRIGRADGGPARLWRLWWIAFAIVIVLEVLLSELPFRPHTWALVAAAAVFATLQGVLMATSLNADPRALFRVDFREAHPTDWSRVRAVVPLTVGTFASFLAAIMYNRSLATDAVRTLPAELAEQIATLPIADRLAALEMACENAVSPVYFQHVVAVIPLILLTLGVEFNFFRRRLTDPAHRATTAATVTLMSAALVFALSTLPFEGQGCNDMLSNWHEFLAFGITVQGIFTGLATLVWMLVANDPDQT